MAICVLGINHKTAELNIREQFTVAETDYQQCIKQVLQAEVVDSAVVISTCNRTEYYLSVKSISEFKHQAINKIKSANARVKMNRPANE